MEFKVWILRKYREWCGESRKTITEFANYIGVSQPVMSNWMNTNGNTPRNKDSITKLVDKYGNEVYEILGLPVPESNSLLEGLPQEVRNLLTPALVEINAIYAKTGVHPDSPEAVSIAEEILSKYGFTINSVEHVDEA